ncbi:MAG: glycosyltransferase [Verrucomicrobia bacterium]|nr:MAG: glycosyltransferase [Verrucomicrobiota bacterium]
MRKVVHWGHVPLLSGHPDDGTRPPTHPGHWVLDLAQAQREHAGWDAQIITILPGGSRDFATTIQGVPVYYLRCAAQGRAATLFAAEIRRLLVRTRALHPDLVVTHGTEESYSFAGLFAAWPHIPMMQGQLSILRPLADRRWFSRMRVMEWLEALTLRRSRQLIAPSDFVRQRLQTRYPHLVAVTIPLPFNAQAFNTTAGRQGRRSRDLLYVGALMPWKGLHVLRAALEQLGRDFAGWSLTIVGAENPTTYWQSEKKALSVLLGNRLICLGQIPRDKVAMLLASTHALVAPSLEDMYGNQVVEALASGTHAIVASATGLEETVRNYGNGTVFRNGDAGALAHAIREVIGRRDFPESRQTQTRVLSALAPERVAALHSAYYKQVLSAPTGQSL